MHSKKDEFQRKLLRGEYDGSLGAELQQQGVVDEKYLERSFNLVSSLEKIQKELYEIFGELPDIITTVGVYPNGPSKINAVAKEDILYHVHYNLTTRGGRGLIIHNKIFYKGNVEDKKLEGELREHGAKIFDKSSAPYH